MKRIYVDERHKRGTVKKDIDAEKNSPMTNDTFTPRNPKTQLV